MAFSTVHQGENEKRLNVSAAGLCRTGYFIFLKTTEPSTQNMTEALLGHREHNSGSLLEGFAVQKKGGMTG